MNLGDPMNDSPEIPWHFLFINSNPILTITYTIVASLSRKILPAEFLIVWMAALNHVPISRVIFSHIWSE